MNEFTEVDNNIDHIVAYTLNGDIELLKNINYSNFTKKSILGCVTQVRKRISAIERGEESFINDDKLEKMRECYKYLIGVFNTEYSWETPTLVIYSECYCSGYDATHKVLYKDTNEVKSVYCHELADLVVNSEVSIPHFRKVYDGYHSK